MAISPLVLCVIVLLCVQVTGYFEEEQGAKYEKAKIKYCYYDKIAGSPKTQAGIQDMKLIYEWKKNPFGSTSFTGIYSNGKTYIDWLRNAFEDVWKNPDITITQMIVNLADMIEFIEDTWPLQNVAKHPNLRGVQADFFMTHKRLSHCFKMFREEVDKFPSYNEGVAETKMREIRDNCGSNILLGLNDSEEVDTALRACIHGKTRFKYYLARFDLYIDSDAYLSRTWKKKDTGSDRKGLKKTERLLPSVMTKAIPYHRSFRLKENIHLAYNIGTGLKFCDEIIKKVEKNQKMMIEKASEVKEGLTTLQKKKLNDEERIKISEKASELADQLTEYPKTQKEEEWSRFYRQFRLISLELLLGTEKHCIEVCREFCANSKLSKAELKKKCKEWSSKQYFH